MYNIIYIPHFSKVTDSRINPMNVLSLKGRRKKKKKRG